MAAKNITKDKYGEDRDTTARVWSLGLKLAMCSK
jgi:hypothetical protein